MSGDPLDRLQRPVLPPVETDAESAREHPIAPVWVGECLRLAGEAAAPTLVFRQRDGKRTALAYGYLTAVRLEAAQRIEIDFVNYMVSVSGRRLRMVFEALATYRALELAEAKSQFDEADETPFIEVISIVSTSER